VYSTKLATLQELWQEIEQSCTAIPAASLVANCATKLKVSGHFEHLTVDSLIHKVPMLTHVIV